MANETKRWIELTALDGQPVLVALGSVVTLRPAQKGETRQLAHAEVETAGRTFWVQEDYAAVRRALINAGEA